MERKKFYLKYFYTYPAHVTDEHTHSYGQRYVVSSKFPARISSGKYGKHQHKREKELQSKGLASTKVATDCGRSQCPAHFARCQTI